MAVDWSQFSLTRPTTPSAPTAPEAVELPTVDWTQFSFAPPAPAYEYGTIARNPETGESLIFNGREWEPDPSYFGEEGKRGAVPRAALEGHDPGQPLPGFQITGERLPPASLHPSEGYRSTDPMTAGYTPVEIPRSDPGTLHPSPAWDPAGPMTIAPPSSGKKKPTLQNFFEDVLETVRAAPDAQASAILAAVEGIDPSDIGRANDMADRFIERTRERSRANYELSEEYEPYFSILGMDFTRGTFRNFSEQAAFSLTTLAASVLAGLSVTPTGPGGMLVAGGAAGGGVAYRIAGNYALRDFRDGLDREAVNQIGRPLSDEEFVAIATDDDMRKAAYSMGLLWSGQGSAMAEARKAGLYEAVPETIGNAVMMVAGKHIFKAAAQKGLIASLPRTVGAGTGTLGVEILTETQTGIGQDKVQHAMGLSPGEAPREFFNLEHQIETAQEVAPVIATLVPAMGGVVATTGAGARAARGARFGREVSKAIDANLPDADRVAREGMNPLQPPRRPPPPPSSPAAPGPAGADWSAAVPPAGADAQPILPDGTPPPDREREVPPRDPAASLDIQSRVEAQLIEAGRPAQEAAMAARAFTAIIETAARNEGVSIEEAYDRYGPSISGTPREFQQTLTASLPRGVGANLDPDNIIPSSYEVMLTEQKLKKNQVSQLEKAVDILTDVPGLQFKEGAVTERAEAVIERMKQNLLDIYRRIPAETVERGRQWYEGAQKVADQLAGQYGLERRQAAGMVAVLSPQQEWFGNVSMAARVADIATGQRDHRFDSEMGGAIFRMLAKDYDDPASSKNIPIYERIKDKTLQEVIDSGIDTDIGMWIRAYDEAYNSPEVRGLTPEGETTDVMRKKSGEPSGVTWQSFDNIGKAASILLDGSPANISEKLGGEHKVRNFYNNIYDPSSDQFVTIDTHAASVATMHPMSDKDVTAAGIFSGNTRSDTGIRGTYPLVQEAYVRAAREAGMLPREMQSVTWEAARGMFPNTFKRDANKDAVRDVWRKADEGVITRGEAVESVLDMVGGVPEPSWTSGPLSKPTGAPLFGRGRPKHEGARVVFEVAPNPDNKKAKARWDSLTKSEQQAVTNEVGWQIAAEALAQYNKTGPKGKLAGLKARIRMHAGGFEDTQGPSISLLMDPGSPPAKVSELARKLGYALRQKSMGVVSDKKFKGSDEVGVVHIEIGAENSVLLYNELRANIVDADGNKLIGGHTTADGAMSIIFDKKVFDEAARKISDYLDGRLEVEGDTLHVQWHDKGKNDYGFQNAKTGGVRETPPESSLRRDVDHLRRQADRLIDERIDAILKDRASRSQATADGQQAEARGVQDGGGIRGSPRVLEQSPRQNTVDDRPVQGLPQLVEVDGQMRHFGPLVAARDVAQRYAASAGIPYSPPTSYAPISAERGRRIADAFDAMEHAPNDPEVKAAYRALIDETVAQWREIKKTGLIVEFIDGPDPYGNPRNAIIDVVENNHLWVFPTDDGFGGPASAGVDVSGNPLLEIVPGEMISGRPVRANDIFRIVHDYFGHIKEGFGFRARGEENAWQHHMAMYSPQAQRALTTETRGQNSWVNFGPHAEHNRTANGANTEYAPQKIGLLPDWVMSEGRMVGARSFDQSSQQTKARWRSALAEMVQASKNKEMKPDQWKGWIKSNHAKMGVKQAEIEAVGLYEYLDLMEGNKLSADQIVDHINENNVEISEVVLTEGRGHGNAPGMFVEYRGVARDPTEEEYRSWASARYIDVGYAAVAESSGRDQSEVSHDEAMEFALRMSKKFYDSDRGRPTEFHIVYELDGERYSFEGLPEAGGTHRIKVAGPDGETVVISTNIRNKSETKEWIYDYLRIKNNLPETVHGGSEYNRWRKRNGMGAENYVEILLRNDNAPDPFRPVHFKSKYNKNTMVHIRMDTIDNGKTARLIEIQSDWGQKGRSDGFRSEYAAQLPDIVGKVVTGREFVTEQGMSEDSAKEWLEGRNSIRRDLKLDPVSLEDNFVVVYEDGSPVLVRDGTRGAEAEADRYRRNYQAMLDRGRERHEESQSSLAPAGPIVDKTESWVLLGLKRAIRHAVDNNLDRIVWLPGEETAKVFSLRNHITRLKVQRTPDGKYGIWAEPKEEGNPLHKTHLTIKELEDNIGKEMAKKAIDQLPKNEGPGMVEFEGLDLEVGGEGMIAFYDEIVPQIASKLIKKWGGKVEPFEVAYTMPDTMVDRAIGEIKDKYIGFSITPEMRQAALGGFTMFQTQPDNAPRGRIMIGPNRAYYNIELLEHADASTFIHESGHFYLEILADMMERGVASESQRADAKIILDWLGADNLSNITREQHEKFARGFEAYLYEGRSPTEALREVFEHFMVWLRDVYRSFTELDVQLNNDIRDVYARILGGDNRHSAFPDPMTAEVESLITHPLLPQGAGAAGDRDTSLINNPVRDSLRSSIKDKLYGDGAPKKERKVTFLLGGPAAGKSTIANRVAKENGALIVDSDMAKEMLPEYHLTDDGATVTHLESKQIIDAVIETAVEAGDNLVIPIVGHTEAKVLEAIEFYKEKSYTIDAQIAYVPVETALRRALKRWKETGRYVPVDYILSKVGNKPLQTFLALKQKGVLNEDAKIHATEHRKPRELSEAEARQAAEVESLRLGRLVQLAKGSRVQEGGRPDTGGVSSPAQEEGLTDVTDATLLRESRPPAAETADAGRGSSAARVFEQQAQLLPDDTAVARDQLADNFSVRYTAVEVASLPSGLDKVNGAEDAAHILAPIRKHAQETMMALVLDKDGKPIEVIRHSKGTKTAGNVDPLTLVGAIANTKGAHSVWFAHNHPGGGIRQSYPDENITKILARVIKGVGIENNGHIIVATGSSKANYFNFDEQGHVSVLKDIWITPRPRSRRVPVTERMIRKNPPKDAKKISGFMDVIGYINENGAENAVLLLSNPGHVHGVVHLTEQEMAKTKKGGTIPRLIKAIDISNASSAIVISRERSAAENTADMLAYHGLYINDIVYRDEGGLLSSFSYHGKAPPRALEERSFEQAARAQTNTPEFKRWFGDSKVVDEKGEPLVVYHTTVADFDAFKNMPGDVGIHFGTKDQAKDRFDLKIEMDPYGPQLRGITHATIPVYLSISNPLRMDDLGGWSADNMRYALKNIFKSVHDQSDISDLRSVVQVRKWLEKKGYDGIIYKNTGEVSRGGDLRKAMNDARAKLQEVFPGKNSFSVIEIEHPAYVAYKKSFDDYHDHRHDNAEDSWIAFRPEQIKSAIGNRGTFDPRSKKILEQSGKDQMPVKMFEVEYVENMPVPRHAAGTDLKPFLDRINSEQDAKDLFARVVKMNAERVEFARRGVITQEETAEMAMALGMTGDQLMKRRRGQAFNAEEFEAARVITDKAMSEVMEAARKARGGTDADLVRFQQRLQKFVPLAEQVLGVRAEWGRLGAMMRRQASQANQIKEILDAMGGRVTIEGKAEALHALDEKGAPASVQKRLARDLNEIRFIDKVVEAYLMSLLSGPTTHAVNMASTTVVQIMSVAEQFTAALVGKLHGGKDKVYLREVLPRALGMLQGAREGARLAVEAFATENPSDLFQKIDYSSRAAIGGKLGKVVRIPGRLLTAEDEFYKAMGFRMDLNARAYRQGIIEGLSGSALTRRVDEIVQKVMAMRGQEKPDSVKGLSAEDKVLWDIHDRAIHDARYSTFTNQAGPIGQWFTSAALKWPFPFRFIMPFIRTPVNIVKFAAHRSLFALAMPSVHEALREGGAARDLAVGRIVFGTGLTATVFMMAAAGVITGGGPSDPRERRIWLEKYQPYSFKVGDRWYSFGRLEPAGMILGISADLAYAMPEMADADFAEAYSILHASVIKNLASKTFLRGISEAVNAYYDPDRYGERWIKNYGSALVPTGVAQLARIEDDTMRRAETMVEIWKSRIPYQSRELLPRLNVFGEEVMRSGSWGPDLFSPVYLGVDPKDPVVEAMLEIDFYPSHAPRKIGGVELSAAQHNEYIALSGRQAKMILDRVVENPQFAASPKFVKQDIMKRVWDESREMARAQLFVRYPELMMEGQRLKAQRYTEE